MLLWHCMQGTSTPWHQQQEQDPAASPPQRRRRSPRSPPAQVCAPAACASHSEERWHITWLQRAFEICCPLLPGCAHAENPADAVEAEAPPAEAPRSVRRTHTPSRTGLTSKAVRLPSRLGVTPGGKHPEEFVVPPSARTAAAAAAAAAAGPAGAAAPATAGNHNLKSILKRLNFSTAKGAAAAASVAAAVVPASEAAAGGQAASAAPAAARQQQAQGQSTIKQLRFFDFAATPGPYGVAGSTSTAAGAPADRHVSFDAATVSPAVRSTRRPAAASAAAPAPLLRTPEPAIQEEDSGSGGEDAAGGAGGAGGSVNSARAGHTPFDRRLSSLFAKYQVGGTPELLPEAELDGLVAEGGWAGWLGRAGAACGCCTIQFTSHCLLLLAPACIAPCSPCCICRLGAVSLLAPPLLRLCARVDPGADHQVCVGHRRQPAGADTPRRDTPPCQPCLCWS